MKPSVPDKSSSLVDLVRDITDLDHDASSGAPAPSSSAKLAEVELALSDLISDDNGEIVFFNDSGFRTLAIETESTIVADGQADAHVTAGGEDVSGFNYVTFDNGITLYFEEGMDLIAPQS